MKQKKNFIQKQNINIKVPLYINSSSIDILLNSQQSSFKYNNIDQFILYSIDTFEEKDNKWSNYVLSTCGNNNNFILGGYCHFSNNETEKKFYIETKHKYIKIKATFNFFDFWEGEFAYLKFNNEIIWYDNYNWCVKALIRNCNMKLMFVEVNFQIELVFLLMLSYLMKVMNLF